MKIEFLVPDDFERDESLKKIIELMNKNYNFVEFEYDDGVEHYMVIAYSKNEITSEQAAKKFSPKKEEFVECTECGAEDYENCDCEDILLN